MIKDSPYIEKQTVSITREYNPEYGDDCICKCGHTYYRHFDTYDDMYPCGCKYCSCHTFVEANKLDLMRNKIKDLIAR